MCDLPEPEERIPKTIRMRDDVYHLARVASVRIRKNMCQWIEEAILAKVEQEAPHLVREIMEPDSHSARDA